MIYPFNNNNSLWLSATLIIFVISPVTTIYALINIIEFVMSEYFKIFSVTFWTLLHFFQNRY